MPSLPVFHSSPPAAVSPKMMPSCTKCRSVCRSPLDIASETPNSMVLVPVPVHLPACSSCSCRGEPSPSPHPGGRNTVRAGCATAATGPASTTTGRGRGKSVPLCLHQSLLKMFVSLREGVFLPVSKFEVPSTLSRSQDPEVSDIYNTAALENGSNQSVTKIS